MHHTDSRTISRRAFLKGLGALALTALPACRRAQQYAIEPEGCPEWQQPGDATCFATSMPWATGAIPMLAVCHNGLPTMLQPNPHYTSIQAGLPAFAQAALLDLYNPSRSAEPTFNGHPYPVAGLAGAFRAWRTSLRAGRRMGFLFPVGYSALREAQVRELKQFPGVSCYSYDPVATTRCTTFKELDALIDTTLGTAAQFLGNFADLSKLISDLPELEQLFIFTPADPAGLHPEFAAALHSTQAETIRFCTLTPDHTAQLCRYTVPLTHFLEEWGADADAHGNLCLRQPVTLPLRPAISEAEALHCLLRDSELPLLQRPDISPAREWLLKVEPTAEKMLKQGFIPHAAPLPTALPRTTTTANPAYYLHPFYADGRFAHNAWLRETWFPLTGCVGTAEAFLPGTGNARTLAINSTLLTACYIPQLSHTCLPLSPQTIGATNISPMPQTAAPHRPSKQLPPARSGTPPQHKGAAKPQWALVINTALCNGCSACTLACRAENNIPTVGSAELANSRDLQWLRIERYHDRQQRNHYIPLACRQCENAPCEAVCPVHATVHTDEGLNAMVYPRCWGTRYCSAACPYEARTFNYRDYARNDQAGTPRPTNPQVSVRSRGIMEKCTYCVQRINAARRTGDSAPQTACQQACPRGAIRLVDLRHEAPAEVLTSFDAPNTRPRTLYL
ncbi:MAG: 4Fe-4S dicluster domain-containing protein [Akkermansia sp.]|nr:4Fe-4S dicluster domain-containing protein [Akkermansia sp.]